MWCRPLSVAGALLLPLGAGAADVASPHALEYDLTLDATVMGAAATAALLLGAYRPKLAAPRCRWCQPDSFDASVRKALVWDDNPGLANTTSSVLANAVLPASMSLYLLLSAGAAGDVVAGVNDVLAVAEASILAVVVNEGVKDLAGRARPYDYYGAPPGAPPGGQSLSFYSGHTSFAFSVVTATVTIASMRGYGDATRVATVGLAAAAAVGYFRVAADQHYLTDVLAGAAVGGLVGFAVPWLLHLPGRGRREPGAIEAAPGGIAIAF